LLPNSDGEGYDNKRVCRGGLTLCETVRFHVASNKAADLKQPCDVRGNEMMVWRN